MNHKLFSYGTLQLTKVQLETFSRILEGTHDTLIGYRIEDLEIQDESVKNLSDKAIHPIAIHTGDPNDQVQGMIYEISEEELAHVDRYEVSDYRRVLETFHSSQKAWVYIK